MSKKLENSHLLKTKQSFYMIKLLQLLSKLKKIPSIIRPFKKVEKKEMITKKLLINTLKPKKIFIKRKKIH